MENRLIEVQDLEVGDEIMISCRSYFKYLKVLSKPVISKKKVHWHTKQPLYSNVMCSTRQDNISRTYTYGINSYVRVEKVWKLTSEDHNIKISQDFNNRQIWLVKREI